MNGAANRAGTASVPRAVLLASGRGSNARALWSATHAGKLQVQWEACLSDRSEAPVLAHAREFGIAAETFATPRALEQRAMELRPDWVILAGYMRILSREMIEAFRDADGFSHIVNIHPSRLPAFPGLRAYQQAFEAGIPETGVTVHLVEEQVDSGPILAQAAVPLAGCRNAAQLEARGLAVEHTLYAETLARLFAHGPSKAVAGAHA